MRKQKNNICYTKINIARGGEEHLFICRKDDFGKYFIPKGAKSLCGEATSKVRYKPNEIFTLEIKRGIFYREDAHKMFIMMSLDGDSEVMPKNICFKCLSAVVSME